MKKTPDEMEHSIRDVIEHIGDNPAREGVLDTPKRVVKSWRELFRGYDEDPRHHLKRTFDATASQMVTVNGISFFSTCEHHMLPFYGSVDVGYIPSRRVVGLSKIARMVDGYARRLQIQERLAEQVADAMAEIDGCLGVAVRVRAQHLCMVARGVRSHSASMTTTALRGSMLSDVDARREWLQGLPG